MNDSGARSVARISMVAAELRGVAKAYEHRLVLRGIDLRIHCGETVAVLGANGSGKSTLLRLVATLVAPTRGTLVWFDQPTAIASAVRRRIGLVPHESLLYDGLTVEENLRFFAGLYGVPAGRLEGTLASPGLGALLRRRARVLSRGQRQQVDLARALLHNPDLLILDEPFTGLDLQAAERLVAMLSQDTAARAVLFATHQPADARALASRAAVLRDGRLSEPVPPNALDETQLVQWFRESLR